MQTVEVKEFNLTVITGDEASESFVIDSQFHRVACSVGKKSVFKLPAGLYSIKVRAGTDCVEKQIALFKDDEIIFEPVQFSTPAPLEETAKTHEFHISNAESHSKQIDVRIGTGSQLYVFVRNWTEKNNSGTTPISKSDPCIGLTLRDYQDDIKVDFGSPFVGFYTMDWEPWSTCNVELNPGIYSLCLETAAGDTLKQTVVVSPGWQSQIFMLQRNYGIKEKDLRADLANSSFFMAGIGQGFQAGRSNNYSEDFRLIEIVRQALINNRKVLTEDVIGRLLDEKFNNPMLGIYAAHLLLLNPDYDRSRISIIVNNLRKLLVEPHPDVEAIALKLQMQGNFIFNIFPMLCRSWNYVLEASVSNSEIVPEDSLASQFAGQFWSSDLWLIWGRHKQGDNDNTQLVEEVKKISRSESFSNMPDPPPDQIISMAIDVQADPQNIEPGNSNLSSSPLGNEKIMSIVHALGLPGAKVKSILKEVSLQERNIELQQKTFSNAPELMPEEKNDDPQKGKWGGEPERNFRKLGATVEPSSLRNLYTVTITVESTDEKYPLTGIVKFHLHDTFLNPEPVITVTGGKAVLKLTGVWGSFTVGAEADDGKTKLELDLANLPEITEEFKNN